MLQNKNMLAKMVENNLKIKNNYRIYTVFSSNIRRSENNKYTIWEEVQIKVVIENSQHDL